MFAVPSFSELDGDGGITSNLLNCFDDSCGKVRRFHQCTPSPLANHLRYRTAHIDINDIRFKAQGGNCPLCHIFRVITEQLRRHRPLLITRPQKFFGLAVRIGQCLGRRKLSDNIGRSELLANFTIGTIGNRSHRSECRRLFYGYISNLELCNQSVFSPLLGQCDGKAAARPCKKGCPVVYLFRL